MLGLSEGAKAVNPMSSEPLPSTIDAIRHSTSDSALSTSMSSGRRHPRRARPSRLPRITFSSGNFSKVLEPVLYKKKKVFESDVVHEEIVRSLKAGESFGDIALLMNVKRTASIRAQTVLQLCLLTDEKLVKISKKYHEMSEVITNALKEKGNKYRGTAVRNAFRKFMNEHAALEQVGMGGGLFHVVHIGTRAIDSVTHIISGLEQAAG